MKSEYDAISNLLKLAAQELRQMPPDIGHAERRSMANEVDSLKTRVEVMKKCSR